MLRATQATLDHSRLSMPPWWRRGKGCPMLAHIVRPLRSAARVLLASDSPRQLAAGFSLGMVLGMLPKGNLIALSLCVLLFSLRVNKRLALVAAILFSCLGPWADSFTSQVGAEVLHAGVLQAGFASVYQLPLGPWLGFHNTVVMGSLLVGLYLVYPVYWASYAGTRWLEPRTTTAAAPQTEPGSPLSEDAVPRREAA
jgi:uncharacterized protein (TIGR03546 family)